EVNAQQFEELLERAASNTLRDEDDEWFRRLHFESARDNPSKNNNAQSQTGVPIKASDDDSSEWPLVTNLMVQKTLHISAPTRGRRQKLPDGHVNKIPFHPDDLKRGKSTRRIEPNWWKAALAQNEKRRRSDSP
ncbi:MAG: hypothetical protein O3B68_22195, partial [Planctomycetota bacterium]|nr:hypothetical protein [Planctomycetota bacterium]